MEGYSVVIDEDAREQFLNLDSSIRERISKKLVKLQREDLPARHLKQGIPVFVEEVGQYRIVFKKRDDLKEKRIVFIGDHKEYEKWFRQF